MKSIFILFLFFGLIACTHGAKNGDGHKADGHACHGHKAKDGHHKAMLKSFDENNDGKISEAEFKQGHQEHFTQIDKNKDGSITPEEMSDFHKSMKHKGCDKCQSKDKCSDCGKCAECKDKGHCEA